MNYSQRLASLICIDAILIFLSALISMELRFGFDIPYDFRADLAIYVVLNSLFTIAFLLIFKTYNRLWSYASVGELLAIIKSVLFGSVLTIFTVYISFASLFPRSITLMSFFLNILFIGGSRFAWRIIRDSYLKKDQQKNVKRALIIGAGDAGALVCRELLKSSYVKLLPVGFIDDDRKKQTLMIYGLTVLGTRNEIPSLVRKYEVDEVIIAMPSAPKGVIKEIFHICSTTPAKIKTLPGLYELINGTVDIKKLRDVDVEDLLGRDPVSLNLEEIAGYLRDKTILVTGAGGSIGSELCRQVAKFNPRLLVLLGRGENSIYEIEMNLRDNFPGLNMTTEIASITDRERIDQVFAKHRPDVVFHAAAHKHVPLMERHPEEAIKNNVFGTKNVAEAADKYQTGVFIMISTDKAVNPTSVMGASKRLAEMIIQAINKKSWTLFASVRFGNVLGSRGSVIPLFRRQIANGGPVTVTHPDMIRYFMTIPEAAQLVIQAGAMALGGETFVLDMGEPVKIVDLAKDLIRLSGYEPDKDIKIEYTGIRQGEKLYEELFYNDEGMTETKHERILMAKKCQDDSGDIKSLVDKIFTNACSEKINKDLEQIILLNQEETEQVSRIKQVG